jgi:alpha-amylase/alpha-mannosidase (GH57 family)
MKKRPPIALVVHGHFYQPPRENPWTDEVPREPTAAPFPNWNARIHAECYRANAYARIYGVKDHIASIVNNYAGMSFDLGPTLARWLDKHDAHVMRRMCEGDSSQQASLGAGGAMAQVWGHPIAPLLSAHDLRTQILWGQFDFRRRFGRNAAGLWLPETAANDATLAALIDAGVAYTILAPEQIEAVREPNGDWQAVTTDTLDTGRAYRFLHPDGSGRHLALAIFDGPLSRDLAFGTATRDAASFLEAMRRSAERSKIAGKRLVLAASDGELYGHHKKFADLTLAYAVTVSAPADNIDITNLGAFLAESPPTWEARLRPGPGGEGTAWSCSHGLGRWLRDCGCRMHNVKGSSQAWRGPLRRALDHLRDHAAVFFEDAAADLFEDPWQARNAYGQIADDDPETRKKFLRALGRPALRQGRGDAPERALLHMEMQRSLLLMYASCAWFFDDISGPEAALALRRAAHAMDTWAALGGKPPGKSFTGILARARSNQPRLGTGADAFARACRDRMTPAKAVARAAFSCMASSSASHDGVPGFTVKTNCPGVQHGPSSLAGRAEVASLRTGERTTLTFAASHDGEAEFACRITDMGTLEGFPCPATTVRERRSRPASHAAGQNIGLDDLDEEASRTLRLGALVRMAAGAREATVCRSLLQVADKLGACTTGEIGALTGLFARALADYLEQTLPAGTRPQHRPSGKASQRADWRLALALADRAGPMQSTDDWRRVQEVVWEHLETLRHRRMPQPKPLRTLAMRLQLAKTAATE